MLLLVMAVKLVAEIALMALLSQWLLGLLAGAKRETNMFYKLLQVITGPFIKVTRMISPRFVLDRHVPLGAFLLLSVVWFVAVITKINLCLQLGPGACR
ncbi:MAG: hypothetical protein Q8R33_20420 [Burkholderiales bacterium]|nr:hypothetical protein [Burkholderiales bacterium]